MATMMRYKFACGHFAVQFLDGKDNPVTTKSAIKEEGFRYHHYSKCPICVEEDGAQAGKESKALKAFQTQADFIYQQILTAQLDNDKELVTDLQQTLRSCKVLWANKLMKFELALKNPDGPSMPAAYENLLNGALSKYETMYEGMRAKKERLYVKINGNDNAEPSDAQRLKLQALKSRAEKWAEAIEDTTEVIDRYSETILGAFIELDKDFGNIRARALELMEEN
ncbi:hypothetical protein VTL71DRAFT_199 [Oculimacula yallundae]|uniref:BAR domain-containing protein n=1 Tax=Oculimacula yallundae TaxID=86028 RepID=A0ABR4D1M7_9HELO